MLAGLAGAAEAQGTPLDPDQQKAIRAATFEVVYPKPAHDSLSYEKPLPTELVPFIERTDQYFSLGTAFALGGNRYVSAAHVIMVGVGSQYDPPALRDTSGHVYQIDQILRFSLHEDFAMFSLKEDPAGPALELNGTPTLNEVVYAVGNALGEGIVIRDGLYTSDTAEEQDGRWKWIRFSAAASPGNSGGPLLDHSGHVVGVVLRKSANENLNYAVAIAQVLNARPVASFDLRYSMRLPVMQASETMTLKGEFPLPRKFAEFDATLVRLLQKGGDDDRKTYIARHQETMFPRGDSSQKLLNSTYFAEFPHLIEEQNDGIWDAFRPDERQQADLTHNGFIAAGSINSVGLAQLRKPDDVPAAALYSDSKVFMDLVLKGIGLTRHVGPESVKITSLGKAATDAVFVDSRGRKWQMRTWPIEYNDTMVATAALAVPSGYVVMFTVVPTKSLHSTVELQKVLMEFIYLSYSGTLGQWRDYLALKSLLPAVFSTIDIDFAYEKNFTYKSRRCTLSFAADLQKITATSGLTLKFGFFDDGGKIAWDVAAISLVDDVNGATGFMLARNHHPPVTLPDSFKNDWDKIVERRHPYTGLPYTADGRTVIESTLGSPAKTAAFEYTMTYYVEGEKDPAAMKSTLAMLEKGTSILER
jgi:serine protease Do